MGKTNLIAATVAAAIFAAGNSSAQDWDVTNTGEPYKNVEFTVDEGTWISLDISPDGQTIVFDLLGDIYRMPAKGGVATLVHGGPAMQHSPQFNPDGTRIVYISDVDGGDNVWTSDPNGSRPTQVSFETSRAVVEPTWSADGQTIAAARHFDTADKLHSSELVTYPAGGGPAEQIVAMPENGENVHDAVYGPDGESLFFVEKISHVHASGVYVDASHKNFEIRRKQLSTGEIKSIVGGFGGATTPVISPSGDRMAFVRRVRDETMLFIYDFGTRSQYPIYDELDRDGQADFLGQGNYYPRFDWFPDGEAIAIWAGGKIKRIDVTTGAAEIIPFSVTSRHRLTEPVRVTQDLAPETFKVKAVSRIGLSPDGQNLVFTALGKIWEQSVTGGDPALIADTAASQSEATYAPNGEAIAFVEWDDVHGGALKLRTTGGAVRTLFSSPGIVRQPTYSQDGSRILFQIAEGDDCLGGYRADPGLFWIPSQGGEPTRIEAIGGNPRFSPDGTRIFFTTEAYVDGTLVTTLESVALDGSERRVHLRTADSDTNELKLSPDFSHVAFRHYQNYYIADFNADDAERVLDGNSGTKIETAGGYELTWSADSSAVHWAYGPDILTVSLNDEMSVPEVLTSVDLELPVDKPQGVTAFVGGRVITMEGEEVIEKGTVVVEGNRIRAVGPSASTLVPDNAHIVDTTGKTIMPGLVDMHGHLDTCYYASSGLLPQQQASRFAALSFGVTTNYDPYTSELPTYSAHELALSGGAVSPRSIDVGYVLYGRKRKYDPVYVPIRSFADAQAAMARKAALGGTIVKSYRQILRRQRQMLNKAGREAGIMVDVEGESHFFNGVSAILDGNVNLQHNVPVETLYDDFIQLLAASDVAHTPTLIVLFGEMMGENFLYQSSRLWEDPRVNDFVQTTTSSYSPLAVPVGAPAYVRGMTGVNAVDEIWDIGFRAAARSMKELVDAGGLVNAGSHGQVFGLAMHWEMQLLAEGGMSAFEVLRAGTINGAKTLGLENQIGSIREGKLADLIVLDANPLESVRNTETVSMTMVNGRLYDSFSMNEIGNYDRPRRPFYWEVNDVPKSINWKPAWAH